MSLTSEDLLAISQILEVNLKAEIQPLKDDIKQLMDEQTRINITIENEIRSDIKLLAENYLPAAKKFEEATYNLETMKQDVELLKLVVTEHSNKLQKIS